MRDSKGKTVQDMFPMLFEDEGDDEEMSMPISEEEEAKLQQMMKEANHYHFG